MAENTELEAFLSRGAPTSEPEPAPVEQPAAAPEPKGEAAAKPAAEPAKPDEPDDEPPEPRDGEPVIPRRAFEAIRHERQDWKRQAIEEKTKREELQRQLEEAKRPQPQAQPQQQYQPPPEIPNPAHDPQGYHNFMMQQWEAQRQQQWEDRMHQHLNLSEMHAVKEHGEEAVEAMKREFLAAKERDPTLGQKLLQQRDPYGWAMSEIKKIQRLREVGEDPDAYDARIRAEAIAEFQANNGGGASPRVSPAAGMAPSLANARSVAGRSAPAFNGPTPLGEIIAQIHRKS